MNDQSSEISGADAWAILPVQVKSIDSSLRQNALCASVSEFSHMGNKLWQKN